MHIIHSQPEMCLLVYEKLLHVCLSHCLNYCIEVVARSLAALGNTVAHTAASTALEGLDPPQLSVAC